MEGRKNTLRFWSSAAMLAIHGGIWAFVWIYYYSGRMPRLIYWKGHLLVAVVYAVILFFLTNFYGGFRVGYYRSSDVALSGIIAMVFANIITWAQVCLIGSAIMTPVPILVMSFWQCVVIALWAIITGRLYVRAVPPHRMLMVYGSAELARSLIPKMVSRAEKYEIAEAVGADIGLDVLREKILKYKAVVLCDVPPKEYGELMDFCFERSIRAYTTPKISDILTRGAADITLFDTPLLLSRNQGLTEEQRVLKRAMDIVLSLVGLIIASPLILLTALAVKLCDGGPVIYKQKRLTLDGRTFYINKFRSMVIDAEKKNGAVLSSKGDGRITPVGKVIRAIRFDELPQLVNILKGDMSVVGPRPERPEIADRYLKDMPQFGYRLKVKAGLTGYAQVYGNYNTSPQDKLMMDMVYISNYSMALDFKIILMTVKILFQKERTEGID